MFRGEHKRLSIYPTAPIGESAFLPDIFTRNGRRDPRIFYFHVLLLFRRTHLSRPAKNTGTDLDKNTVAPNSRGPYRQHFHT